MLTLLTLSALAADPLVTDATVHTLDNGLTVVLEEDTRSDTIALHLYYGVGARDELEGEFGCAHLFEHLMFEGSAKTRQVFLQQTSLPPTEHVMTPDDACDDD